MNKSNIKSNKNNKSNKNIKSKLLPINLQSFASNNFILKSNNINSLCQKPGLFKVTQKRDKLTTEEILRSLDTILFPDTQILEPMMDLYNLNVPNMLILVIFCLILNKKISKRTQKILCEIKESDNEKEMFKLVSRIPYKEFYKFLQKFLCAIKFHLNNLNDYYKKNNADNNSSKKKNKNVEFLRKYIEGSNEIIRDNLVLDGNKSGIINLGITTIVYLGYLINNIFYETYINKAPDIDKLRSLMNGNKLLNENGKSYVSVSDSFLFCVYIYDIFNYIVVQILLPNLYKNINLQRGIDPKLFIEYFEYDKALYKKNIVMRHILEMEQKYFKFYKDISFKELLKMNLDKFVLEGSKTNKGVYTLKRDLRRSFLNDELFKLTNEIFTILDTNLSNKNNKNNNNSDDIKIRLNEDKIIIKGKKNGGYKFLKCVMTNKGKVDCKNVYNIGFDGREILKIETGENGKTICSMGYIEQDKTDKNKYSVFFNRPILRDKALKIAEIKLQTAYNKVKIKFTAIYQFLELMIVTFISFRLINEKAKYKSERDRDIPKCVFRRISKNLRLIEC